MSDAPHAGAWIETAWGTARQTYWREAYAFCNSQFWEYGMSTFGVIMLVLIVCVIIIDLFLRWLDKWRSERRR